MAWWAVFWAVLSAIGTIPSIWAIRVRYGERSALRERNVNGRRMALVNGSIEFEWIRCAIHIAAVFSIVFSFPIISKTGWTDARNLGCVFIQFLASFNSFRAVTETSRLEKIPEAHETEHPLDSR